VTTTIAQEVESRKRGRPARERMTFASSLCTSLVAELEAAARVRLPSDHYRKNPVAFFREILGVEPWSKQVEVIEAIRDHPRVAVASGHKVSKSHTAAGVALWYFASFPDARVVLTSTTSRQVDQILWRELKMMRARGGRCLACKAADPNGRHTPRPCPHSALLEGDIGELARTGLKSGDFREIVGFTAREAEAVAGISGRHLLYLADEASGIPDEIFEAIEGNRAGGARIAMFSNPTRNQGEFFEAFTSKSHLYKCIRISSEESPNVVQGEVVIPGLATREWIDEKKLEWGEDSAMYKVRVLGEFALHEDGKIFSIHMLEQAEQRWHDTPEAGRLFIGLDPAGPSGSGDETVFAVRRGLKLIEVRSFRGLSAEAHLVQLLLLLNARKLPRETPVVVLDREGAVGAELYGLVRNFTEGNPAVFELVAVRASDRAIRQPQIYDRARDELAANLEAWFRDGGAILEDVKLSAELHTLEWKQAMNGRMKVTPKDFLRKHLGRSPDRYDALALAAWEPLSLRDLARTAEEPQETPQGGRPALDPYAGQRGWERR
jgi:phage terminase large subunit